MRRGIVYLVGAGPGDPGLLTRRGAEVLARAEVVAYDRLVHPDLLSLAPGARLVDVGKRPGGGGRGQSAINELLVTEASAGRTVVRLKGGDPFVFGRGGEEAQACAAAGIPFEVVPGVTSAVAGPAYAGIPLTHREHASWVAIATGHEDPAKEEAGLDWRALAAAPTAVFLMGISRLPEIARELVAAGKPADEPVAVVASATLPGQRIVRSSLAKVADDVAEAGITPPAILVVGRVAALADELAWLGRRPLHGVRVFVARSRARAGRLSGLLRELGAEALEFPAIETVPPAGFEKLDAALGRLETSDWVVFTSANGVSSVFERLEARGSDARAFGRSRVAAVGPATAGALRERGIVCDLVPTSYDASSLATAIGDPPSAGGRVLLPLAEGASTVAPERLRAAGWDCEVVTAYATRTDRSSVEAGRRALAEGVDAVLFTSGSTVSSFIELWGRPPAGTLVCCIGPRTAETAREAGIEVDAVAGEQTVEALADRLVEAVGR